MVQIFPTVLQNEMNEIYSIVERSKISIATFIAAILILYATKPTFLFEDNGHRRQFGLGYNRDHENKTIFDMTVVVVILAVLLSNLL